MARNRARLRRIVAAFLTVAVLLTVSSTAATAKAAKKTTAKKKTTKKAAAKKATKKPEAAKGSRTITGPAAGTTAARPRPSDVDPNGELTIAWPGPPSTLDPDRNSLASFTDPLYDRLTFVDDSLTVRPMLATGWSFPSKSVFEMTLRSDVNFEDGTHFDAAAVKANIERSKNLPGSLNAPLLKNITSVDVVSPTVVRFNLAAGGAELPSLFAQSVGMMKSPKVLASGLSLDTGTRGGGSGAYTVDQVAIGDRVVYKQSKMVQDGTYWDKSSGLLKKLTWIFLGSTPQRINAVRSGDIDLAQITNPDTSTAKALVATGEVKGRLALLQTSVNVMWMRNTRPPFDNLKFRQALEYAIDKDALNKGLYDGNCEPTSQFYRPEHWAHSATVDKRYTYNHDLAQQMIKDSGIFNPTFTLVYGALYAPPAQAIQGILGDYGINVKLQVTASTDTSFRDGQADATVAGFSGQIDPSALITTYYLPTGVYKLASDPDGSITRDATAAADPTISQAASAKLYDSVWQKLAEQAVTIHLCNSRQIWIHKGKVANLDDLAATWAGIADSRYLYVKK